MSQWIEVCALDDLDDEDVVRFDYAGQTYALYRYNDKVYTSQGLCTHERVHLADWLVMKHVIECPKHNGRFDIRDGKALGAPVCVNLKTFPTKVEGAVVYIEV